MELIIKGQTYKVKYTIRALFIFEQITGKAFNLETTLDNYVFFYSLILANNQDKKIIEWDEFLDAIDSDPTLLKELLKYLQEYNRSQRVFETDEEDSEGEKKN